MVTSQCPRSRGWARIPVLIQIRPIQKRNRAQLHAPALLLRKPGGGLAQFFALRLNVNKHEIHEIYKLNLPIRIPQIFHFGPEPRERQNCACQRDALSTPRIRRDGRMECSENVAKPQRIRVLAGKYQIQRYHVRVWSVVPPQPANPRLKPHPYSVRRHGGQVVWYELLFL